jgi:hypothetical protein
MSTPDPAHRIETLIGEWRDQLRRQSVHAADVATLEARLRDQFAHWRDAGLDEDEALQIALGRVADVDRRALGFARRHADRHWSRRAARDDQPGRWTRREGRVAFGLAVLAALLIKLPDLLGLGMEQHEGFYFRNLALFVLPSVAGYLLWQRGVRVSPLPWLAALLVAALAANLHAPMHGDLEALIALHLPIALWLGVGIAHAGGRWRDADARMDFARFSGELFIHYVLMALGGMVLTALMMALFFAIHVDMAPFFARWLLPCGATGALVIATWLADGRRDAVGQVVAMLARLFTPLFALLLLGFLATMAVSGRALDFQRELLIALDLLLVVVTSLVLYVVAARDPSRPAGLFDALQLTLVLAALLVDALALWSIATRISEFGFTPNRVAALGENLLLFANLAGSALLYLGFLRGRVAFARLARWQTVFLPLYAGWAAIVVLAFPLLFGAR